MGRNGFLVSESEFHPIPATRVITRYPQMFVTPKCRYPQMFVIPKINLLKAIVLRRLRISQMRTDTCGPTIADDICGRQMRTDISGRQMRSRLMRTDVCGRQMRTEFCGFPYIHRFKIKIWFFKVNNIKNK